MIGRALVLACVVGCGEPAETFDGPSDVELAAEVWDDIQGWEDWTQIAPWEGIQPSSDCTHGAYVQITYNELAAGAYGSDDLPDGSVIVKRGYDGADGSGPVGFVTVMKKVAGYDPDNNDWYWLRIDDLGQPSETAIGRASFCINCHVAGGTDYLLTTRDEPGDGGCD